MGTKKKKRKRKELRFYDFFNLNAKCLKEFSISLVLTGLRLLIGPKISRITTPYPIRGNLKVKGFRAAFFPRFSQAANICLALIGSIFWE